MGSTKNDSKIYIKVLVLLMITSLIFYIGLYIQNLNGYYQAIRWIEYFNFFNKNETEVDSNAQSPVCYPINIKHKPYRIKIDNQTYPRYLPLRLNDSINFECLKKNENIKKILFWNPFFGSKDYAFGLGKIEPFVKNSCPVTACEVIFNNSRVNESDLVIVHMRDGYSKLPEYRPKDQRWVFTLYESPMHASDYTNLHGFFNMTSTYKIDSDFPDFYANFGGMIWKRNHTFDEKLISLNKTQFAAAIISNCGGYSKRLDYIKELQNFISVNVYGNCGKPCPKDESDPGGTKCKEKIAASHKFFFAFENSICKDYITEKLFNILRFSIVPVVLGGGDYEYFIPKSGFINVKDYKTPKDLADYLVYLAENSTAYQSYFKWKKYVQFVDIKSHFSPICDMCIKLHLDSYFGIKKQVLNNLWSKKDCH